MPTKAELEERIAELEARSGGEERSSVEARSYASKSDYPCSDCGHTPLNEVSSAAPDQQVEFDCPSCGLHHIVSNSRFTKGG